MKRHLIKNGIILGVSLVIALIITLVMGWSMTTLSNSLTGVGLIVLAYGAAVASNIGSRGSRKERQQERNIPGKREEREKQYTANLISGWLTFATGGIIIALSVLVTRL
ncbi:hypothetical protein EZV73_20320 [Acidaminobacter sp. JC074]|uniref:hypothetical protein n=1 Tax=Acidaminobacter sp. JC074 TaxID=2530199 RepID=UPI001F0D9A32|nr:hypothetical protein [Acidaminobacter sp. JC074]MCH4889937.1 hypothetical protein [Acidaminobacter sp. JC074]